MIVSRRNVNDFIVGNALARNRRQEIYGHQKQQKGAHHFSLVREDKLLEHFEHAPGLYYSPTFARYTFLTF